MKASETEIWSSLLVLEPLGSFEDPPVRGPLQTREAHALGSSPSVSVEVYCGNGEHRGCARHVMNLSVCGRRTLFWVRSILPGWYHCALLFRSWLVDTLWSFTRGSPDTWALSLMGTWKEGVRQLTGELLGPGLGGVHTLPHTFHGQLHPCAHLYSGNWEIGSPG